MPFSGSSFFFVVEIFKLMNFDCNHVIELVVLITINLINLGFGVFLAVLQAFEVVRLAHLHIAETGC